MADEREPESPEGAHASDPAALHYALSSAAGSDEARAFLRKQAELAALQVEQLREEMPLALSNLRFRRLGNFTRTTFEIAIGLVVLLAVCGIGTMVWNATQDNDLVVDAFSVPADVAQSGMTGGVLAGRILDSLGHMQARTYSLAQGAGSYRSNSVDQVRVEMPSTGISIGELDRYLREWLGHETHVVGDLVHTAKGYALTIRYGDQPGSTIEDSDLSKLIDPARTPLSRRTTAALRGLSDGTRTGQRS
jgi:hypothetical protein